MSAKQHYPLLVKKHHIMTLHHSIPINKPGSISPSRATMATCREKSEVKKNWTLMQKILYQLAIEFPKKRSTNSISQNYYNEQEMSNLLMNYFFILVYYVCLYCLVVISFHIRLLQVIPCTYLTMQSSTQVENPVWSSKNSDFLRRIARLPHIPVAVGIWFSQPRGSAVAI